MTFNSGLALGSFMTPNRCVKLDVNAYFTHKNKNTFFSILDRIITAIEHGLSDQDADIIPFYI